MAEGIEGNVDLDVGEMPTLESLDTFSNTFDVDAFLNELLFDE
jgi:hypothetical protein